MNASQKIAQYLSEVRASEDALTRVLQSQIAMTPRGSYRTALETHLEETRRHSARVADRLSRLDRGWSPMLLALGVWEDLAGQAIALGKVPFDLMRGTGGEEKVLKNAKDAAAAEALEIATYTAIERLARAAGDDETAELASDIRADEERMLDRIMSEIPKLTDAVVSAELQDDGFRIDALSGDQPWPGYDGQTVAEIEAALDDADDELAGRVGDYERSHKGRSGVLKAVEREASAS